MSGEFLQTTLQNIKKHIDDIRKLQKNKGGRLNLLDTIHRIHYENYNSYIIAYLLNPTSDHKHETEYLKLFLKIVDREDLSEFDQSSNVQIERESSTDDGRIDIFIRINDSCIILENKIYAKDQPQQLSRYYKTVNETWNFKEEKIYILYLTLKGTPPSDELQDSVPSDRLKLISYKDHILPWITNLPISIHETSLQSALLQYKESLEILTNQTGEDIMEQKEILKEFINDDGTLKIDLDSQFFSNMSEVTNWLIYLVPLLDIKEELKGKSGYTAKLMISTDDEDLEKASDFSIEKFTSNNYIWCGLKIENNKKESVYFTYHFVDKGNYLCVPKKQGELEKNDWKHEDGYNYYWKWFSFDTKKEMIIQEIEKLFK